MHMENRELVYTVGGKVGQYSHYGTQYAESLKKIKRSITIFYSNPTPEYISKGNEISMSER